MIQWKKYWKYDVRFIFNKESDYSEENTSGNEDFRSTIFQPFQFESEPKKKKKTCGNESHENETKLIYNSAADLLHIRKRNLNWYKFGHCKNEAREIHCPCCRQVDVILIASAKIWELEGSIWPSSFYRQLHNYELHVLALST